jgi:ferrochelatase
LRLSSTISPQSQSSTLPTTPAPPKPKVGVLLCNLGGPKTLPEVQGFLYNLFADPAIIRLPICAALLQKPLAAFISSTRAPKAMEAYASIGGGSPIVRYTNEQAVLIREKLKTDYNLDVKTYIGMRYWYPLTEEALDEIYKDGIESLVVLPLYPQFSISTTGSSLILLARELYFREKALDEAEAANAEKDKFSVNYKTPKRNKMEVTVIDKWYDRPGYLSSMASIINKELDSFTPEQLTQGDGKRHVLFSAHGVPQSYIRKGDPYQKQIIECVDLISKRFPPDVVVHLSYQSRVGPIEWLRPYTDDVLPELGKAGVKNLVVVPISFVSEHIETLEEIDMEYRELAEEAGISNWKRAQALNTDPIFIDDMALLVQDALTSPIKSIQSVCDANACTIDYVPEESVFVRCGRRTAQLGVVAAGVGALATNGFSGIGAGIMSVAKIFGAG